MFRWNSLIDRGAFAEISRAEWRFHSRFYASWTKISFLIRTEWVNLVKKNGKF